ncbi:hypothetical protein [Cronobacter muytjensii]|uniref:hypothetical protein n=1 Tax=Cronobacter muytjensii TaxID=413501 RepID=UPI00158805DF|nr:hypothetical protein [Cronobacter muytjensii]NUW61708.1 hypothetical protein [Cronobacter muytjensii]
MKGVYNFNPQSVIYDGDEQGFYNFECELNISAINKNLYFKNLSARPIWESRTDSIAESISVIKGVRKIEYPQDSLPSYKNGGLDIYFQEFIFNDVTIILVIAAGERQPTRYIIKKLGYIIS